MGDNRAGEFGHVISSPCFSFFSFWKTDNKACLALGRDGEPNASGSGCKAGLGQGWPAGPCSANRDALSCPAARDRVGERGGGSRAARTLTSGHRKRQVPSNTDTYEARFSPEKRYSGSEEVVGSVGKGEPGQWASKGLEGGKRDSEREEMVAFKEEPPQAKAARWRWIQDGTGALVGEGKGFCG